ncbi:MAG TPA: calcium-binding protein [Solirubrobacterales bacterium]|jgi:Ca2+-binding RTX toxin-like protein
MPAGPGTTIARRIGLVSMLALAAAFAIPAAASANTTCSYNSAAEVLSVNFGAPNDSAIFSANGTEIRVSQSSGPVTCANGPANFANTEFISIGGSAGATSTSVSIHDAAAFAAAVRFLLGAGDSLNVFDSLSAANHFVIGNGGVDSDADGDRDIDYSLAKPEEIAAFGGNAEDTISAQGSAATGAALTGSFLKLSGEPGNDVLDGGEAGDLIEGGDGNDVLSGHGGNDRLIGDALVNGDDTIEGGAGVDKYALPFNVSNPLTLDLGKATPQATGYGNDTVAGVESAEGTGADDVLIGDAGPNELQAGGGNDLVEGKGGDDVLDGSAGVDTLSYANAPAGVAVNLSAGTASGGDGADTLTSFENLTGSRFADTLTGSAAANAITAGAGADVVQALGGADLVDVRDGVADNASCGSELDKAVSDRRSLDTIQPDCEVVDAVPELGGNAAPRGDGAPGDMTLDFRLSAKRTQRLVEQKAVVVRLRCPAEACTATVKAAGKVAKIKKATKKIPAGPAKTLKLHLKRKQRDAIEQRLLAGRKPKLKVTAIATDAAGNMVSRTLTVTAKL